MNIQSIRFKLPAFFLLVAIYPTFLSLLWGSRIVNERVSLIFQEQAQQQARISENIYQNHLNDLQIKTQLIAQNSEVQASLMAQDKVRLLNHLNQAYQDLNLHIFSATIEVFTPSAQPLVKEPAKSDSLTPRFMVLQALGGQYKQVEILENKRLKVVSLLPIYNPSRSKPIGILSLSFYVSEQLLNQIEAIHQHQLIFYTETGAQRDILASTLGAETAQKLLSKQAGDKLEAFVVAKESHNASNGTYFLAVAQDNSKLIAVMKSLQWMLFLIQGGATILALILAFLVSRNFLRKIKKLVLAAREIEKRNLDTKVDIGANDEFGILSKTLDSMRQEIKDTLEDQEQMIAQLTLRDKINQAIIAKSGTELLEEVLILIMRALESEKGSIMLVDNEAQRLVLKVVYNHEEISAEKIHDEVSFKIGEGIAGYVAQTGETVISNDPQNDSRFKQYHFQEMDHRIHHLACLPLKSKDEIKGVLSLDNKPGGFEEKDIMIVQAMLNQVAIALENAELYELSITDGLTGLFIRRYFENNLDKELTRSERFGFPTSVLIFDIDHFKRFNDTYGHQVGDQVIQKVAKITQHSIRDGIDFPARIGGEEFALIMPDTDLNKAHQIGERLRKAIEDASIEYGDKTLKITVSLGCAEFPLQSQDRDNLLYKADMALYASKQRGRNQTTCYTDELDATDSE